MHLGSEGFVIDTFFVALSKTLVSIVHKKYFMRTFSNNLDFREHVFIYKF